MSDSNWWFADQAIVIAVTGALSLGIFSGLGGGVRIALAIPLVLFLPGYALVSALFPDRPTDDYQSFDEEKTGLGNPLLVDGGLEAIERIVLSITFSLALVSAIALFTSATPGGLTASPVLSALSVLTVVLALLAIGARYRCAPDRRFVPSVSTATLLFTRSRPSLYSGRNHRPYNAAIVISLVLLVASAGFAVANPPQHDGFTEFSIDTEELSGETETMYESTYTAGETEELAATITNREHEDRTYTTVLLLQRVSYEDGDVTVQESTELDRATATVPDGETHRQSLEVTPTTSDGEFRLALLLYDGEPSGEPSADEAYRVVHLPIEVE
ncbi:DUF1616 domain-containing protein [Halosolutus amylolyticus]|uniref:DUF1616 domain-containing protein n=1 Tax=Halosolutus amylolyticus TaxID=2932267 RepID=A0ABD5PVJ8_9EURY|nr:DUF1616 domain-containing protein [Halosolutus amylolyticus]